MDQVKNMNPNYSEFKFPNIKPHPWNKVIINNFISNKIKNQ